MASEDAIKGTQDETETQSPDGLFLLSDLFFVSVVRVAVPFL